MALWSELKRRNVVRVALAYVVTAWVIIEVSSLILDTFGAPEMVSKIIVTLTALGLPFALLFAWAFEVTPEGIKRESDYQHPPAAAQQTGRRLNLLTIAMVVLAIALLAADRFLDRPAPSTEVAATQSPVAEQGQHPENLDEEAATKQPSRDAAWAAQQMLELNRLKDLGKTGEAFDLARQVAEVLPEVNDQEAFWDGFTWSNDIDSVPSGAKVWRQKWDASEDDWEYLGQMPLKKVRFAQSIASRVRIELDDHHRVEVLQEALMGPDEFSGFNARNPVILDPLDESPEDMVRLPGFTQDLVEYGDYYMGRFEVTNREFANFVTAGGYDKAQYWTEPFSSNGQELPFTEAMARFVDRTGRPGPATWSGGAYPSGEGDHPVGGISWFEAAAYANFVGKTLPSVAHHEMALRLYLLNGGPVAVRSNLGDGPRKVGENRAMTSLGLYDHIGNVREWCWNELPGGNRCSFGAAWSDLPYRANDVTSESPWDRAPVHGIRLAMTLDNEDKLARLRQPDKVYDNRDFDKETPASDAEFEILMRFYTFDPIPLNGEVEETVEFELWRRERVAFDLPSGKRGAAYLFIPHNLRQPVETILFWPGSDMLNRRNIDVAEMGYSDFLIKSGRVMVWPVLWGTLDRDDPDSPITSSTQWGGYETAANTTYRDLVVTWVKELSRTIDYLESRPDIYSGKLGFYGVSWGGFKAPIPLAIEVDRFDTAVLAVAGLDPSGNYLPEGDAFNFIGRVTTPVLMINGEFDTVAPKSTSGDPMFKYLGTDPAHKKMYLAPSSHIMPGDILIRETLNWFDHYLSENLN